MKIGPLGDQMAQMPLPRAVAGFELRVYSIPGKPYPPLVFGGLHIIKRASLVGLHQRENMRLLADLVALRLEHPTITERIERVASV